MKKTLLTLALTILGPFAAGAQILTAFFTDGPLVGQNGFVQNGSTATNPIQVVGGRAVLTTSGQDVFTNFSSAIPSTSGTSAFFGLTINVTSAGTGDYFAHFTNGASNPTQFSGRLAIQNTTGGFFLGLSFSTAAGTVYGTTPLLLNTDYRVVLQYDFVAGALNDTGSVYVATTAAGLSQASPYVTGSYAGATAELTQFTGFQFRQGTAAAAAGVAAGELVVASNFATAATPVPEPSTVALGFIGLAGLIALRRRRD